MEQYGICLQSMIPLRGEPAESGEMGTQLLFGEHYTIIEQLEKWTHLRSAMDNYEGWIDRKLVVPVSEDEFNKLSVQRKVSQKEITFIENKTRALTIPLPAGSSLPLIDDNGNISIAQTNYFYNETLKSVEPTGENAIKYARQFLNAPYLWGGKTYLGIDCSGLSQVVYAILGHQIPRDASQQVTVGETVSFVSDAKAGDLAFFDNEEGNIIHVGIMIDDKRIIHASGWVRIDPIDHQGIFKEDMNKYSHKLRVIKRILD